MMIANITFETRKSGKDRGKEGEAKCPTKFVKRARFQLLSPDLLYIVLIALMRSLK